MDIKLFIQFILYSNINFIWLYYKMPRKLSKKKTLRGGWGGSNTYMNNTQQKKNTKKSKKVQPKKKNSKNKKGKTQNGGSWRSKSIFF